MQKFYNTQQIISKLIVLVKSLKQYNTLYLVRLSDNIEQI